MNLYAWYSWPNVVLSFVGGFLIDKVFGVRLGASIFSLFLIAGQFVFAAGAFINVHWLCYLGRFIFGIGGESLAVAQNTYTVKWFSGMSSVFLVKNVIHWTSELRFESFAVP